MTDTEVAFMLEALADKVQRLPGVSRTQPHAFAEAKSDLRGEMLTTAKSLRNGAIPAGTATRVTGISPGTRTIGRREVCVVRRGGRG